MISAKIVADSVSPDGVRLVTMQLIYPRFIHSELMTHRVFSRNAASSRAIPIKKLIEQVQQDPAMPVYWGKNQPGMQAKEELEDHPPREVLYFDGHRTERDLVYSPKQRAISMWKQAARSAVKHAEELAQLGVHKQIVNRLLEPWQNMQTIVTATEWDNFYNLRRHPDAQPEIKALADAMWDAMADSAPRPLKAGEWHLPYINHNLDDVIRAESLEQMKKWSTARCARVSYLNHDKSDPDPVKDESLHDTLRESGHFSPFEHQATPGSSASTYANFRGWKSYRYILGF